MTYPGMNSAATKAIPVHTTTARIQYINISNSKESFNLLVTTMKCILLLIRFISFFFSHQLPPAIFFHLLFPSLCVTLKFLFFSLSLFLPCYRIKVYSGNINIRAPLLYGNEVHHFARLPSIKYTFRMYS